MNRVVAEHPGREMHVILDNLNTHKPKHDRWLARHENVRCHFTPTHASWLNQVEVWFSIICAKALAGASFTWPRQVRNQIDAVIAAYNQHAHPFEWTKQAVCSRPPRAKYADLSIRYQLRAAADHALNAHILTAFSIEWRNPAGALANS